MGYTVRFSEEKDLLLKTTRKVSFQDVLEAVKNDRVLDDLEHHDKKKYPRQRIIVVEIDGYAYVVPYVIDRNNQEIFLKTVYPSRKLSEKYIKGDKKHEKE